MDFNFDLNLVQSQKLILTPQLKQALEILRMNYQELFEYVEDQLETNPALELVEENDSSEGVELPKDTENIEWEEQYNSKVDFKGQDDDGSSDIGEFTVDKTSTGLSITEYLLFQLNTSEMEDEQRLIGEYIIDNIDENGYLAAELSEVAAYFNISVKKVTKVLEYLQSFDPPGICARNLKECLMIQLRQKDHTDDVIVKLVENHLDDLAANRMTAVAKSMGLSVAKIAEAFEFIKSLEPKPGREFYHHDEIKYIIPDMIVKKIKGKFEVLINEDAFPLLNIDSYYRKAIHDDINPEAKKFIQSKMDDAAWLIKCIEQRKNTLKKVAECIVNKQIEFFEKGKRYIKPLTMKKVAKEVGMHESTVSRTVNGKYMQSPWGVFELRYFFTAKLSAGAGKEISNENIKEKLKSIIKSEDKRSPLSDNDITEQLNREGIEISRRTVAKYRTELGIPTVSQRKKY